MNQEQPKVEQPVRDMRIWKVTLPPFPDSTVHLVPKGATILSCQPQWRDQISIWLLCDSMEQEPMKMEFLTAETGAPMPKDMIVRYLSTAQFDDGKCVLHVFQVLANTKDGK